MCGILGLINFPLNENEVINALSTLKHRGPDNSGFFFDKEKNFSLILSHNRLEILDIKMGKQPMISNDKNYVIVYNGEIYNFRELRLDLESLGHKFITNHSDTEILIHGYKEWGGELPKYLNGMWSFAIYDKLKKEIFLSKDRFGEKPLFYYSKDKVFLFASELGALTQFKKLDLKLDYSSLKKYCAYGFFPGNLTPFKNINKLEAGCNLLLDVSKTTIKKEKYWEYLIEPNYKFSESEWCEKVYDLFNKSVKRMLVADVPVGVFLSGGLDSSIISYFSQKHSQDTINTFSIGFEENTFDETKYSKFFSEKIKSNHYNQIFAENNLKKILDEFSTKIDEPISDSSLLSYYLLCKFSSNKVKVALGGDGGDELFGGYDTFKAIKYANLIKYLKLTKLNPALDYLISKFPTNYNYMNYKFKLDRFLRYSGKDLATSNCEWLSPLNQDEISIIFDEKTSNDELYSEAIDLWHKNNYSNNLDKSLEFYTKIFLQNQILVKTDRLSMMNSLEVRSPFLDKDLVECVRKIPAHLKLNGSIGKYILKKTFSKTFGEKFTYRKKVGFSAPLSKWIKNNNIDFSVKSKFLKNKKKFINKKLIEHSNYSKENRIYLWNLFNLDNFLFKNNY